VTDALDPTAAALLDLLVHRFAFVVHEATPYAVLAGQDGFREYALPSIYFEDAAGRVAHEADPDLTDAAFAQAFAAVRAYLITRPWSDYSDPPQKRIITRAVAAIDALTAAVHAGTLPTSALIPVAGALRKALHASTQQR